MQINSKELFKLYLTYKILQFKKIIYSLKNKIFLFCLFNNLWPSVEHQKIIKKLNFDEVIDIGANKGQFSFLILNSYENIPVIAYEPLSSTIRPLTKLKNKYKNFYFYKFIISNIAKPRKIIITKSSDNSSLLPPSEDQISLSKNKSLPMDYEIVESIKLDSVPINKKKNILLKIDVQGLELEVLKSGANNIKNIKYIIIECSHYELYEGQNLWFDINEFLISNNFELLYRYNDIFLKNKIVQYDFVYKNSNA